MKKSLAAIGALLLASASPAMALSSGQRLAVLTSYAHDPSADAYFAALASNHCNVPSARFRRYVVNYVLAQKAAGNWGNQDAFFIEMTTDACTASVNLAQPSLYKLAFTGACTYAIQTGLDGDATSCVGNVGVAQSALTKWTQNNGHMEIWQAANKQAGFGLIGGTPTRLNNLTNKATQMNSSTTITDTAGGVAGLHYADRTSSALVNTGVNGVAQTTGGAATSAALNAGNLGICEINGNFCTSTTHILFVGFGGLMNNEAADYANVNALRVGLSGAGS